MFLFILFQLPQYIGKNGKLSNEFEKEVYDIAVKRVKEKNPDFKPVYESMYVSKHRTKDEWYAYIFDARDKGLGYEVYYDNGIITDNYNGSVFKARQEIIKYMNEVMPENKNYNEYVSFNPFCSSLSKTYGCEIDEEGRIEYSVISHKIDIAEQINKDYLILKKSNEILKRLGKFSNGISVDYFEIKDAEKLRLAPDWNYADYNYLKRHIDRNYIFKELKLQGIINHTCNYIIEPDNELYRHNKS